MDLATILDMVADGIPGRVLVGDRATGLSGADLRVRAAAGAGHAADAGARRLLYLGSNGPAFPVALFAAALAGIPFLPVNYRLGDEQLADVMSRQDSPLVVTDEPGRVPGAVTIGTAEFRCPRRCQLRQGQPRLALPPRRARSILIPLPCCS